MVILAVGSISGVPDMGSDKGGAQDRLAQWVEHRMVTTVVAGSSPAPKRAVNPI